MDRPQLIRRLSIAASVFFAVVAVALVVLWVRSYWWRDAIHGPLLRTHTFDLSTSWGRVRFASFDRTYEDQFTGVRLAGWGITSRPIEQPTSLTLVNTPLSNFGLGFADSWDRFGVVAIIPVWFPVLLAAMIAVAPWIKSSPQFSLRTLLIATTLVALVLGLGVWAAGRPLPFGGAQWWAGGLMGHASTVAVLHRRRRRLPQERSC